MRRISVTYYQPKVERSGIKKEMPDYSAVYSQVLQDVVLRVDRAFHAFFRRLKAGEAAGSPRFQGRNRYHGFLYPQVGEHGGARLDKGFLVLAKIGRRAVRWSRPLEGTPKTVTVSREADGWYVSLSCADVPIHPLPEAGQETGIDLGLEAFATLADGTPIATPRIFRLAELQLQRAQRRVARRVKWSNRRRTAVTLLAKAHAKVRRARRDFHHQAALALVRQYGTIDHEALQAANMVQNHSLAKSISDAGWGQLCTSLSVKAAGAGRRVVAVPPAHAGVHQPDVGRRRSPARRVQAAG